ncbi:MAG: nitroreductase family protein [Armatimonadota bacterium]|nr:nitroreductase family protein [Armatimonadota bacterium]
MTIAIDPVCEMEVEEATAAATSEYQGRTYYFCAPGCKAAFDEDPERYLRRPSGTDAPPDSVGDSVMPGTAGPEAAAVTLVEAVIKSRRSITRMRPDPVPREAIKRMLDAAVWAPNHHLTEPWEFIVLTGEAKRRFAEIRREFRRTLFKDPAAPEIQPALDKVYRDAVATPVVIVVTTTAPDDPDLRDDDYGATMCAIQNMLLVGTALGLGTYLRTGALIHFPPLHEFLGLPSGRRIAGIVYVGHPDHRPARRRTPFRDKTRWLD